jgi:dCMP deaminase
MKPWDHTCKDGQIWTSIVPTCARCGLKYDEVLGVTGSGGRSLPSEHSASWSLDKTQKRPSRDQLYMDMAKLVAQRTTCLRRAVGCVLVNKRGHVLATGYNGVAAGQPHCNQHDPFEPTGYPHACAGHDAPSGTNLDACQAIHAGQNALLQCRDIYEIDTCYCTASPCMTCTKLLLNTSCQRIVFAEEYPHNEAGELWTKSGRVWVKA